MDALSAILRDVPESFETERLLIRCPRPGDGTVVNSAICESLPQLRPWFPWAANTPSVADTEANLRRAQAAYLERSDLRLLLLLKSGEFVGSSGLHRIDWSIPRFEIGYWLRTGYEGRGLATEAAKGIATFALHSLGAQRVEIRCDASNLASARVAVRAGFTLEARLRNSARDVTGELRDTLIYVRLSQPAAAINCATSG